MGEGSMWTSQWSQVAVVGLALAAAGCGLAVRRPEFCIARDGQAVATIVTAREPVHAAAFAAAELQYHFQKITGARVPIVGDDVAVAGPRILVGESAATRKLGLRAADLAEQEYLVRFLPDTLVLLGRDAAEPAGTNVSLHGAVEWTEGRLGRAVGFNGTDAAVTVADCGFRDDEGSLEAWVWLPPEPQAGESTILRLDGSGPWSYHILRRAVKTSRINYVTYDGSAGHGVTSRELVAGWHHVLATYSVAAGTLELFVDGASQGTAKYSRTTCKGATLHIGGIAKPGQRLANPFRGRIDEVRVSTVRRSPDASGLRGPRQPDAHTALLLHLDEGKGVPADASGIARPFAPPAWNSEQATSYAAHDFLERSCGVRWFGPTELAMDCPRAPTLAVAPRSVRRAPAFTFRVGHPKQPMPLGRAMWNHASLPEIRLFWARLKGGGEKYACNHSFYGYYDRFWKTDKATYAPWFAQGYEGKPPQMCFTNQAFIQQAVADARAYFDGKGADAGARASGPFFGLVPMDNGRWCKCPACQAQMDKAEQDNPLFNNGKASDYVFGFVNQVAREVRKTHPDKYLSAIAYHDYAYVPRGVKLEPNVTVQMCLTVRHWWAPCMKANDLRVYREWVRREGGRRPLYLWLYYCFPELMTRGGKFHCFPGFSAHTHAEQIKMFARDGIRGVSTGGGRGEQVDIYITLKLLDDPSLDVDDLLDDFFTRYYGAAAEPMKRIYLLIEQTYGDPANYPEEWQTEKGTYHQSEEIAWRHLGTAERMARLGELMDQARRAARTDLEKRRLAVFDKGAWQYMVEGRRRYLAKQAAAPARKKLKAQPPPSVRVPRAPAAGGDPAKADWSKARALSPWYTVEGYRTERKVAARIVHDGRWLYVQLEERCDATKLASAGDIWRGDDWEVFFAAARAKPYHQLGVAPSGKFAALAYGSKAWESGAKVVSDTSARDRWRVRLALPLERLIPGGVAAGGRFHANFYRASPAGDLLAWSPNFAASFHELSRLGEFALE